MLKNPTFNCIIAIGLATFSGCKNSDDNAQVSSGDISTVQLGQGANGNGHKGQKCFDPALLKNPSPHIQAGSFSNSTTAAIINSEEDIKKMWLPEGSANVEFSVKAFTIKGGGHFEGEFGKDEANRTLTIHINSFHRRTEGIVWDGLANRNEFRYFKTDSISVGHPEWFTESCGDRYVDSITSGTYMNFAVHMNFKSPESKNNFETGAFVDLGTLIGDIAEPLEFFDVHIKGNLERINEHVKQDINYSLTLESTYTNSELGFDPTICLGTIPKNKDDLHAWQPFSQSCRNQLKLMSKKFGELNAKNSSKDSPIAYSTNLYSREMHEEIGGVFGNSKTSIIADESLKGDTFEGECDTYKIRRFRGGPRASHTVEPRLDPNDATNCLFAIKIDARTLSKEILAQEAITYSFSFDARTTNDPIERTLEAFLYRVPEVNGQKIWQGTMPMSIMQKIDVPVGLNPDQEGVASNYESIMVEFSFEDITILKEEDPTVDDGGHTDKDYVLVISQKKKRAQDSETGIIEFKEPKNLKIRSLDFQYGESKKPRSRTERKEEIIQL